MTTDTTIPTTPTASASATKPASKSVAVMKLLSRARGATVAEVMTATGWQPHSVRAYLSGLRKGGRTLDKEERKSGETSYRLITAVPTVEPAAKLGAARMSDTAVDTNVEVSA